MLSATESQVVLRVDLAERGVVVVRVVGLATFADHQPASSRSGEPGVSTVYSRVVAKRLIRQEALTVLERLAVLLVRKRTAGLDRLKPTPISPISSALPG